MSATICGYERDALKWALDMWAKTDAGGIVAYSAGVGSGKVAKSAAFCDVNDPAKLAKIMAERGRQLGFGVYYGALLTREKYPMLVLTHGELEVHIRIAADRSELGTYSFVRTYLMPTARALLLQWLQLPTGTPTADVLHTLEAQ